MTAPSDFLYVQHLIDQGAIRGRALELGSLNRWTGHDRGNFRGICQQAGIPWEGTDITAGRDVDFTLDLLDREAVAGVGRQWDTLLVMNLLEHVYDPIRVLEHALLLLAPGGGLVVVSPAVWQIHGFPCDYWRPLPDFYLEFAERNGLRLDLAEMRWLTSSAGIVPLADLHGKGRQARQRYLPSKFDADRLYGEHRALWSRLVHRAMNTIGRDLFFPYSGLGVRMVSADGPQGHPPDGRDDPGVPA